MSTAGSTTAFITSSTHDAVGDQGQHDARQGGHHCALAALHLVWRSAGRQVQVRAVDEEADAHRSHDAQPSRIPTRFDMVCVRSSIRCSPLFFRALSPRPESICSSHRLGDAPLAAHLCSSVAVLVGAGLVRACELSWWLRAYSPLLLGAPPLPPLDGVDKEAAELMPEAADDRPAPATIAPTTMPPGPPVAPPAISPMDFAERTIDPGRFMPK